MRSLRRVLCLASVAGIWIGCTVNQMGLTNDGGVQADVGAGVGGNPGVAGHGGASGAAGSVVGGSGGGAAGNGAGGGGGSIGGAGPGGGTGGGAAGTTGSGGSAGTVGAAGTTGGAGTTGDAGTTGTGGITGTAGTGGSAGTSGNAGTSGSAGTTGGSGGTTGVGGSGGSGGSTAGRGGNGNAGRGGTGGGAGRGGAGGRGGSGGNPCVGYPSGTRSFVTPTDGRVHCYWARPNAQTWSEASQSCMLQNGHLVTILSAEENDFVVGMAVFSTSFSDTWIGATDGKAGGDKTGAGTYRWVTNETWGYTSWAAGQPDGFCDPCSTGQTCTCDHRATLVNDGTWTDRWQDNGRSSVCEATPN